MTQASAALCELCDWVHRQDTNVGKFTPEQFCTILTTLHFVVKHPERYDILTTERTAEEAALLYHQYIKKWNHLL